MSRICNKRIKCLVFVCILVCTRAKDVVARSASRVCVSTLFTCVFFFLSNLFKMYDINSNESCKYIQFILKFFEYECTLQQQQQPKHSKTNNRKNICAFCQYICRFLLYKVSALLIVYC